MSKAPPNKSVLVVGATGTIGRATVTELLDAGYDVTCIVRPGTSDHRLPTGAQVCRLDLLALSPEVFEGIDAVVSCLASRTGTPVDAWAIDHDLHANMLKAAKAAGVAQFVLLSAICVQKPKLAFQQAKRAFEEKLKASGLIYSIVRPTAFFKSLSGQVERVKAGKPFLVFGDGRLTSCKPISDRDLARFLTLCLTDTNKQNQTLPIGGPGPALTPEDQGKILFELLDRPAKFRRMPVVVFDAIVRLLSMLGAMVPSLHDKAELAKIGRYYGTESMLVWDGKAYSADDTPSFGSDTLRDHYRAMIAGDVAADLGDHAVFKRRS